MTLMRILQRYARQNSSFTSSASTSSCHISSVPFPSSSPKVSTCLFRFLMDSSLNDCVLALNSLASSIFSHISNRTFIDLIPFQNGIQYSGEAKYVNRTLTSGDSNTVTENVENDGGFEADGIGMMTYQNGDCYRGELLDSQFDGVGSLAYANQSVYTGEWSHGQRNGHGTYIDRTTGEEYVGEWKANQREGEGCYFVKGKVQYQGAWKSNERHGYGTAYFYTTQTIPSTLPTLPATGAVGGALESIREEVYEAVSALDPILVGTYRGDWSNGSMNGAGTYECTNGDYVTCEWMNGHMSGNVIRMDAAGNQLREEKYDTNGQLLSWKVCQQTEQEEIQKEGDSSPLVTEKQSHHDLLMMLSEVKELQNRLNDKVSQVEIYMKEKGIELSQMLNPVSSQRLQLE